MWGSFMDQAKSLAANIDKQLNESVGLDASPSGGHLSTSTSITTSTSTSSQPAGMATINSHNNNNNSSSTDGIINASTATTGSKIDTIDESESNNNNNDSAWNDDFNFDDDDDDDDDKDDDDVDNNNDIENENSEMPASETKDELPPSSPPKSEMELSPPSPTKNTPTEPSKVFAETDTSNSAAKVELSENGWEAEDGDVLIDGDDMHFPIKNTFPDDPTIDQNDNEIIPAEKENMEEIPNALIATMETTHDEEEATRLATTEETTENVPKAENSNAAAAHRPSTNLATAATSLFSNFAHRADELAHKATEKNPIAKTGMASLFKVLPIGSAVKQPAGTMTTTFEANDDGKVMEDGNSNAWDGDGLDIPDESQPSTIDPLAEPMLFDATTSMSRGPTDVSMVADETKGQGEAMQLANDAPITTPKLNGVAPTTLAPSEQRASISDDNPASATPQAALVTTTNITDHPQYQQLLQQLASREEQLANKSMQITDLTNLMDQQEQELKQKIAETKEEAKKRIMRAKERCEVAEAKLKDMQTAGAADVASQNHIIQALREEGEKLAHKQSAMEQAVRAAKAESRELAESLEHEMHAKEQAMEKISKLESELKTTKESLNMARKGESQASKLENDLLAARADSERKATTILSLQQQVKELSTECKELQAEMERIQKVAAQEAQQEKKTLRREHNDVISDLEAKLRTTEREAGVREDALRHEVAEVRKRWQDAVRRADALSMDVQSSTAPLLRQLESMERQNRVRAANWAELENRLRSELEETVIQNETLSKERMEFKTKHTRLERSMAEQEQELKQARRTLEDQSTKITKLEAQLAEMETLATKQQEEYSKVERLANEGVMKVRSEMSQTVLDSEERYRGQIDKLESELRIEREKRSQLEKQVEQLLENAGMIVPSQAPMALRREAKPKKLREAEGQAQILAGALGFDTDSDNDEEDSLGHPMDRGDLGDGVPATTSEPTKTGGMNSFAALDQLTSRLKAAKIELEALRKNLKESEALRDSLVEELAESRSAKEKLPLFEAKVKELTEDNREKALEIEGLRDDIAEVRELYRTQLNVLLEEKALRDVPKTNGASEAPAIVTSSDASSLSEQLDA